MTKTEWGLKRVCPHCNTRYYDMKKNPPVCPSCGSVFDPETLVKAKRGSKDSKKAQSAAPEEALDDLPVVASNDDDEDAVIEDVDELSDDAVEEVVEVDDDSSRSDT